MWKLVLLLSCAPVGGCSLLFETGSETSADANGVPTREDASMGCADLLSDDFSSGEIDPIKWSTVGGVSAPDLQLVLTSPSTPDGSSWITSASPFLADGLVWTVNFESLSMVDDVNYEQLVLSLVSDDNQSGFRVVIEGEPTNARVKTETSLPTSVPGACTGGCTLDASGPLILRIRVQSGEVFYEYQQDSDSGVQVFSHDVLSAPLSVLPPLRPSLATFADAAGGITATLRSIGLEECDVVP